MAILNTFRLTRYFSALSLALILIAGGILGLSARSLATHQMTEMAQGDNEAMGRIFIRVLWPEFSPLVASSYGKSAEALRADVARLGLEAKTVHLMAPSHIVKIKVYNRDGLTVFSSDPRQIGESRKDNTGFQSALAGKPVSELTHRNSFDSFEGARAEVDLISSYLPIHTDTPGEIPGVMELYQDVTSIATELDDVLMQVVVVGGAVLLALYLMQLIVVNRAQGILRVQEERLVEANRELDARVAERTQELAQTNTQLQEEVAERRRAEVRLDHLAHHDPLTGLPNRLSFSEHLNALIANTLSSEQQAAVLFIDLDRFKDINDTMGHTVGDELLCEVARRLVGLVQPGEVLARLGGDEFVYVMENVRSTEAAAAVAQQLIARIAAPVDLRGYEVRVSASIGISLFPTDGHDTDNQLRAADTAMYEAKRHGRNTHHFYTAAMTQYAQERALLERHMRQSIVNNELEVHYQLKVAAPDGARPSGAEALVRWNHPELGAVAPSRFIPLAEETGFIVELGTWVLRTACKQMAQWRAQGIELPLLSVNLSVRQLARPDVVDVVRSAIEDAGIPATCLELEITESVIMNAEDSIQAMESLTALGVNLSVDDFGTGYSSLAYLKMLPIHTLKIDRSFVIGIGDSRGDQSIIRAVIGMAKSLGLSTIAEGVETQEQLAFLQKEGCDQIQGYLFGKPMPAQAFASAWQARMREASPV